MIDAGVLGGSFDPIHNGHLRLARESARELGLAEVWIIPANRQPLKPDPDASGEERLAMCRLAAEGDALLRVCDLELVRPALSYSIDTVRALTRSHPGYRWWFLTGTDSLLTLPDWREPDALLSLCRVVAVERGGVSWRALQSKLPAEWIGPIGRIGQIGQLHVPVLEVSSTEIRAGGGPHGLVPERVERFILEHKLYGKSG